MTLYDLAGDTPSLDPTTYIAPGARLIGRIKMEAQSSVWFNAVLRGDNEPMVIGRRSNIQDNAVAHVDPGFPLTIGEDVTVGHSAIVHGCTIGDGSLIGMGAVVMNGAVIGKGCLIGAGAIVTEGKEIPDYSMVLGQPGKVVKELDEAARDGLMKAADVYVRRAAAYARTLERA